VVRPASIFLPCIPIAKNKKRKQRQVTMGSHALAVGAKLRRGDGRKQSAWVSLDDGEISEEESNELEPRKQEPGSGTVRFSGFDLHAGVCRGAEEAVVSAA
jgi:hypothetical protein